LVGGVSAVAVAAGFVVTMGVGPAGAASGSVTWNDGNSKFTRTVSNSTPSVGETVKVSTKFERTGGVVEWLQAVKDLHPTCLTYVSGNTGGPEVAPDYVRVTGNWPVYPNISPQSQTFEFNYLVTANCARETPLMTTMHYSGSLGSGTYADKGPTITVAKDATTTSLATVPSPVLVGQSVTLSATVTGGAQGDAVDFYDGATKIGSGQLNASGVATSAWTPSAGAHSLQAKYLGTAKASASQSAAQSVSVSVSTSMTVSAPATAVAGTAVTLSATVTPSNASGTVQFKDNGTAIGSPVAVAGGAASLQHTFTAGGSHSITADFIAGSGLVNSSASAQTVNVSVPDVATTTTVTAPGTAQTGAQVTLSADVTPNPGGGTVQFKDNGADIGSPVALSNGGAQLPHTFSAAGQHSITAEFSGVPGFTGSASTAQTVAVSVPDAATTTTLTVPPTAETGQSVTLTANVDPVNASGTVQFQDNGADIGSPVSVSNGVASLQHTFTAAGAHSLTAVFTGSAGFTGSTSTVQTVNVSVPDVETATTLSVPATAETGQSVTLTANVDPVNASGTVQFQDNGANIGSPVTVSNGVASVQHTFTTAGSHSIAAAFTGNAGFLNSTAAQSVSVTDPVVPDVTTTSTLSVPATAETGQPVTLTANVTPANASGTVQFADGGADIGAPVQVVNGTATLEHTFITAGAHDIGAVFTGAPGFAGSSATQQQVQVSDPAPGDVVTSTVLTVPGSATVGQQVKLSATVSGAGQLPGTVRFFDGATPIGDTVPVVGGVAELDHTFTTEGPHTITAKYSGGEGVKPSVSAAKVVQVSADGGDTGSAGSLGAMFGSLGGAGRSGFGF